MKSPMIVGLAGPAGSGKSTLANMVQGAQDSFAKPIYAMLEAGGFGRPTTQEEKAASIPGLGVSWRTAAQTLGTEWGRSLRSDIWLLLLERRWRAMHKQQEFLLVTDVRFENEAAWCREHGVVVHMMGRDPAVTGDNARHASEGGLVVFPCDLVLNNSGNLTDLRRAAIELDACLMMRYDQRPDEA